jgi:hypothetical protein
MCCSCRYSASFNLAICIIIYICREHPQLNVLHGKKTLLTAKKEFCQERQAAKINFIVSLLWLTAKCYFAESGSWQRASFYGRRENDLCRKFKPKFEPVINSNKKLIIKFHYFSRCTTFIWVNSSFDKVIIILFTKPISLV